LLFFPHYLAYLFIYAHSSILLYFISVILFLFCCLLCLSFFSLSHFASAVVVYASCSFSCEYLWAGHCSCVRAANVNEPVQCQSRSRSSVRSIGHEKAAEGEKQSRRKRGSNPARSLLSGGSLIAFCKERMEIQENCSSQKTVENIPLSVTKR